jgi:HD-like signal output (HDOD) protein
MKLQIENFLDEEIKTLPAVFHKLKEASQDPDSTFDQLGEIIGIDPGLSARLLKIVTALTLVFLKK